MGKGSERRVVGKDREEGRREEGDGRWERYYEHIAKRIQAPQTQIIKRKEEGEKHGKGRGEGNGGEREREKQRE